MRGEKPDLDLSIFSLRQDGNAVDIATPTSPLDVGNPLDIYDDPILLTCRSGLGLGQHF
jgi:hypothetical protein